MTRTELFEKAVLLLTRHGFSIQSFYESNVCFDLIARKQSLILVLKILINIDALRNEHAQDLHKIATAFGAHAIVIGEKSKVYELQPRVLYDRYELPVLSIRGLELLLDYKMPLERSFKGKSVVELDFEKLKEQRQAARLTQKALSQKAHISLESLYRYEQGSPAQLEAAQKLEEILGTNLIQGINVFETAKEHSFVNEKPLENEALSQLQDMGMKLSVFERAPLKASGTEHQLLISQIESKKEFPRKSYLLEKTQQIIKRPGLILTKNTEWTHRAHIPAIAEEELSTFSTIEDMLKTLHKRYHAKTKK
jgi:putative transcriptional regulator